MPIKALVQVIAAAARHVGVEDHTYIVGGAPRDVVLGVNPKDLDVVVEDLEGNGRATLLAEEIAKRADLWNVHPDQYGVIHVGPFPKGFSACGKDLSGQKIEIVTARQEKYDKGLRTGSHKPVSVKPGTILDDLKRRDFTINTLMWCMADVPQETIALSHLPVVDMLNGLVDLALGVLRTPLNPQETFDEDPSRILRAVRFSAKYSFRYEEKTKQAMSAMAGELRRLPYELLDGVLCDKILPLPLEGLKTALHDLEHFGLLSICFEKIPEARLRRVVDTYHGSVHVELLLNRYGFPSSFSAKLRETHKLWLHAAEGSIPTQQLALARDRFIRPPLNVVRMMAETGVKGPAIGRVVEIARDMLLENPFVGEEALHGKVTAEFTRQLSST